MILPRTARPLLPKESAGTSRSVRQHPNHVGGCADRGQTDNRRRQRERFIQTADGWHCNCRGQCWPRSRGGHSRTRGYWRSRTRTRGCRSRSGCWGSRAQSRSGGGRGGSWSAGRKRRQLNRRRGRRLGRQVDPDRLLLGLNFAGLFLGRQCAAGHIRNVLCHNVCVT